MIYSRRRPEKEESACPEKNNQLPRDWFDLGEQLLPGRAWQLIKRAFCGLPSKSAKELTSVFAREICGHV